MFTSTGSSGLYKAPLSKSLLLVPSALSLLLTLLLPHCQKFFVYDLHAVKHDLQIWRLICGRIICLDLKDAFCSGLLIYNFRIFERRYGSRKFASSHCMTVMCPPPHQPEDQADPSTGVLKRRRWFPPYTVLKSKMVAV